MSQDVYNIIAAGAEAWPDDIAVVDHYGSFTYAELHHEVEALKQDLLNAGLRKGHGFGVMMQNSRAFIVGVFAGLGCGATVMPLSHQLKRAEVEGILDEVAIHAVLDDLSGTEPPGVSHDALHIGDQTVRLTKTACNPDRSLVEGVDAAFVRFTSGTTGKSKGVAISHQAVMERTKAAQRGLGLSRYDTVIWVLPMAYHFIVSIVLYLRYGIKIAIAHDVMAPTMIACINENEGTMLYAAPMHYRLLAAERSGAKTPTLKRAISTSSAIPVPISEAYTKRYGLSICQAYGIIEVGLPIMNLAYAKEHPESIGHALPDYVAAVLDEDGDCVPAEEVGQLAIKGPGMFETYLSPKRSREEVALNGWFLTGDLATMTEDGLLTIVGREKSMINVSGNKVFPEEVEQVLNTHPAIALSKVSGREHPIMGEAVQAEVTLKDGAEIDTEEVLKFCRQRLSTYKVPQFLNVVEAIEMTGSGKVAR